MLPFGRGRAVSPQKRGMIRGLAAEAFWNSPTEVLPAASGQRCTYQAPHSVIADALSNNKTFDIKVTNDLLAEKHYNVDKLRQALSHVSHREPEAIRRRQACESSFSDSCLKLVVLLWGWAVLCGG